MGISLEEIETFKNKQCCCLYPILNFSRLPIHIIPKYTFNNGNVPFKKKKKKNPRIPICIEYNFIVSVATKRFTPISKIRAWGVICQSHFGFTIQLNLSSLSNITWSDIVVSDGFRSLPHGQKPYYLHQKAYSFLWMTRLSRHILMLYQMAP